MYIKNPKFVRAVTNTIHLIGILSLMYTFKLTLNKFMSSIALIAKGILFQSLIDLGKKPFDAVTV